MTEPGSTGMDTEERDEFLGTGGTGVLAFASPEDESPHAVPVSYGYDSGQETFYFRLAVSEGSEKGELTGRPVTFVVYGQPEDAWQSVVASGHLEGTTETSVGTDSLEGLERVHIPMVDIFGRPARQVDFEFYRLVPDEFTGRAESSSAV